MLRIPSRLVLTAGALVAFGVVSSSPSQAFWPSHPCGATGGACTDSCGTGTCDTARRPGAGQDIYQYLETGRQTNAMWPYPYVCPDRIRAHAPFDAMVSNGWRRQCMLGRHHFDAESGKLTRAGELKVRWILTQTPPNRRQIFIESAADSSITEQRVAVAQEFANGMTLDGSEAMVAATNIQSEGRPAAVVDRERSLYIENRFPPIDFFLEASSTTSGSN